MSNATRETGIAIDERILSKDRNNLGFGFLGMNVSSSEGICHITY